MKVETLLQELQGDAPFRALDEFNASVEESSDPQGIIHGLLLATRRCNEILDLFQGEKRTHAELSTVFTCLGHVLLNIASDLSEYNFVGVHITKELLHRYPSSIYRLTGSSTTNKTAKSVLRCLTGMVMIGGQSAYDVLATIDWEKIGITVIANRQSTHDVYDVRAWCIYLMLAFMNSEDPHLIKTFLLKNDLLPTIFPSLVWDPCERVINVLMVMREAILHNARVTKTMKIAIFTPTTTKHLLDLYKWMGPVGKLAKGGELETLESEVAKEIQQERAQVKEVLQKFLLSLCTSTQQGILFKVKLQAETQRSSNWILNKILSNLKTPWDSPEESELMSSFLGKCPDLFSTYLYNVKTSLQPRSTRAFTSLMSMLTQAVDNLDPESTLLILGLDGTLASIIPQLVNHSFITSMLESDYSSVRFSGIKFVFSILSKIKKTREIIKDSKEYSQELKYRYQEIIMKKVLKEFRSETIVSCWEISSGQKTTETDESKPSSEANVDHPDKVTELLYIVRVMTLYNELHPKSAIHEAVDPRNMLDAVHTLPGCSTDTSQQFKAKLELQVLCLELLSYSKQSLEIVIDSCEDSSDYNNLIKENVLCKLIITYAESCKAAVVKEDEGLKGLLTEKCYEILSNSLAKVGLPVHYDGNVKYWLKNIPDGKERKIAYFLTKVVQKAVSSLHHYTDTIIKASSTLKEHLNNEGLVPSLMDSLEAADVENTEEVSMFTLSLPFSRLVLATVDLLEEELDPDYVDYFSRVVFSYQYFVNDPELLAAFLLQKSKVLSPALVEYLRVWCRENDDLLQHCNTLGKNASLSEILKYLFMTNDLLSVEPLLESDNLKELICMEDLDLIVSQLLLYMHLTADIKKQKKIQKKYASVLKSIYLTFARSDPQVAQHIVQSVLEHPRVLSIYQPFSAKISPMTELVLYFLETALQKYSGIVSKTGPYFDKTLRALEGHLNSNESMDQDPLSLFLVSEHTIVTYEAAEQILTVCLKTHLRSHNVENIFIEVVKLITKTTSAKRKLKEESVELLLSKFMDWGNKSEDVSASQQDIIHHLETLLIQVLNPKAIEQLTKGDLKSLLQFEPPCSKLCCHIMKQHPEHSHVFAKHLKKHRTVLPHQAPLLAQLLDQSDTAELATEALRKVVSGIETWVMDFEGEEDETSLLLPHVISRGLLGDQTVTDFCHKLYEDIVVNKQPLSKKLLLLLPVFKLLPEAAHSGPQATLPQQHIAMIHIGLSCIKTLYQKENRKSGLLLDFAAVIRDAFQETDESLLRKSLINNKLWPSFVKQVLRVGITDSEIGHTMMQILDQLCSVVYKKSGHVDEGESVLPVTTLYQMIITHSQYMTLMFAEEDEWDKLKERVVALQQTLVDCEEKVCQESHVPILLGAYGASMSLLDQRILKLLSTYERKGSMTSYQPVLWGKDAVAHFGVKSQNVGVFRNPSPEQILGLLNMDKILHTCYNFETRLPLEPTDIYKENKEIYDVRFLLPLMLYLAGEEKMTEIDYAECGAVMLGLIALTSHHREVQGAGAAILRCMVVKMEASRRINLRLPWIWLVGVVSCALDNKWRRLPALTVHFLIYAAHLLTQPQHSMYSVVLNYVFLRPSYDIYSVPELLILYNSQHITDSRAHRSFLLFILSSGIRQILDYKISQKNFTPTLMMGMLQSPTTDAELSVQVLEVVKAMVRIPLGAVELVTKYSLLTVLCAVLSGDTKDPPSNKHNNVLLKSAVVGVLAELWKTLFGSTVREDIEADGDHVTFLPETEDDTQAKRKLSFTESLKSSKKRKLNSKNSVNSVNSDVEIVGENEKSEDSSTPRLKMLPPLFIQEFLNTLILMLPVILEDCPPTTLATYLQTVTQVVKYSEHIREASHKKKIRLAALDPDVVKQQVFKRIQWTILHDHLQGHLSDEEEVRLLGDKCKDLMKEWRNEPLGVPLQRLQTDSEHSGGVQRLKKHATEPSDGAETLKPEHEDSDGAHRLPSDAEPTGGAVKLKETTLNLLCALGR